MSDPTQDQSIFGKEPTQAKEDGTQSQPPVNDDATKTFLAAIKNERGEQKYATLDEALKALKHAQEYIPELKATQAQKDKELEELRAKNAEIESLKEAVQKLTQNRGNEDTPSKSYSEEDIAKLVESQLSRKEKEALVKANQSTVAKALAGQYGDDAEKLYNEKAVELGLSIESMNALAAQSPKAVLKMLGVSEQGAQRQPMFAPSAPSVNSDAFKGKPQDSFIGREKSQLTIGATDSDIRQGMDNARRMVEELEAHGLTTQDLSDPKVYAKFFK